MNKGFNDNSIIYLFAKSKIVQNHYNTKIQKVHNLIILIETKNTDKARTIRETNFYRLIVSIYLYAEVKVALTINCLNIKDKPALGLYRFIFADFSDE